MKRWWNKSTKSAIALSPWLCSRSRTYSVRWMGNAPLGPNNPKLRIRTSGRPACPVAWTPWMVDGANMVDGCCPRRTTSSRGVCEYPNRADVDAASRCLSRAKRSNASAGGRDTRTNCDRALSGGSWSGGEIGGCVAVRSMALNAWTHAHASGPFSKRAILEGTHFQARGRVDPHMTREESLKHCTKEPGTRATKFRLIYH